MRIFDAMCQQMRQRQSILWATWARNRRQRLVLYVGTPCISIPRVSTPRVSDVRGSSWGVYGRCWNPIIDGFSGKGVINDQLFAIVGQVRNVALDIQRDASMLRVLHCGTFEAIPRKLPPTLGAKLTNRQHGRT
jgi:hypothetical protein